MKPDYLGSLDGLRAVAILLVLVFHLDHTLLPGGFVGVDVFFVISGYIITRNIIAERDAGTFSFSEFYKRRLARLFPAAAVTVMLTLGGAMLIYGPDTVAAVGRSAIYSLLSVVNIWFWMNSGYFEDSSSQNPLLHMWSLSVEEQFYIVWPALIVFGSLLPVKRVFWLSGLFVISLAGAWLFFTMDPSGAFYLMPARIFQFAIGAALAAAAFRVPAALGVPAILVGLAVIGASAWLSDGRQYDFLIAAVAPAVGAALAIAGLQNAVGSALLGNLPMRAIGLRAYAIYLVHWPIAVFAGTLLGPNRPLHENAMLFVGCLLAGDLLHRMVEKPLRLSGRAATPGGRDFSALRLSTALLLVAGSLTLSAHVWALNSTAVQSTGPVVAEALPQALDTAVLVGDTTIIPSAASEPAGSAPTAALMVDPVPAPAPQPAPADAAALFWASVESQPLQAQVANLWRERTKYGRSGDKCGLQHGEPVTAFPEDICLRNGSPNPRVMVIGDSLSVEAHVALEGVIPPSRMAVAGTAGCSPEYPEPRWANRPEGCQELNIRRFEWAKRDDFDAFVLTANWRWTNKERFMSMLRYLKELGKPVIVFGPRAQFSEAVPGLLGSAAGKRAAEDLTKYFPKDFDYRVRSREMQEWLKESGIAHVYIPWGEMLCSDESCKAYSPRGELMYMDAMHIPPTAAMWVGTQVAANHGAAIRTLLKM